MLAFEMRKLCPWPSKQTLTKKNQKKKPKKVSTEFIKYKNDQQKHAR